MVERLDFMFVGLLVFFDVKVGKDVGEIVGIVFFGVVVIISVDEIVVMDVDVVIYMFFFLFVYGGDLGVDVDYFCCLFVLGKNVIIIVGYMYFKVYGIELVVWLELVCKEGGMIFYFIGVNLGWFGDIFFFIMLGMLKWID